MYKTKVKLLVYEIGKFIHTMYVYDTYYIEHVIGMCIWFCTRNIVAKEILPSYSSIDEYFSYI